MRDQGFLKVEKPGRVNGSCENFRVSRVVFWTGPDLNYASPSFKSSCLTNNKPERKV